MLPILCGSFFLLDSFTDLFRYVFGARWVYIVCILLFSRSYTLLLFMNLASIVIN